MLLNSDLAELYGVTAKRLSEKVRRNIDRFPEDFIFPVSSQELVALRSQFATLKLGRGAHRKYAPIVFTEHGAIMAATVLNSPSVVQMSVHVVRAFVKFRQALASTAALSHRLESLERLLFRLSHSRFADQFILKGALLFNLWFDLPQRPSSP